MQNENVQFAFDTFLDRRNSVAFQFNPIGGRMDGQVTNEGQYNGDWNPLWRLQVRRNETGWTAEADLSVGEIITLCSTGSLTAALPAVSFE